jgi:hypothetical protein
MKHDGVASIKGKKKQTRKMYLRSGTADVKDKDTNLTQAYLKQRNKISVQAEQLLSFKNARHLLQRPHFYDMI